MKNDDEKIIMFFNMYCDVHYAAKIEIKIQLVYAETKKKTNCFIGYNELNGII